VHTHNLPHDCPAFAADAFGLNPVAATTKRVATKGRPEYSSGCFEWHAIAFRSGGIYALGRRPDRLQPDQPAARQQLPCRSTNPPVVISPNVSLAPDGSLEELPRLWTRPVGSRTPAGISQDPRTQPSARSSAAESLFIQS
jgi:hypothetical protein